MKTHTYTKTEKNNKTEFSFHDERVSRKLIDYLKYSSYLSFKMSPVEWRRFGLPEFEHAIYLNRKCANFTAEKKRNVSPFN